MTHTFPAPGAPTTEARPPRSGAPTEGGSASRSSLTARVLRSWWTWGGVALLLVLVGVVWATGGLEEVPEEGLPQVPADARVALGPYDVALQGWSISREYEADTLDIVGGDAWLVIAADLTGAPPRSSFYQDGSVTVSSLETTAYPEVLDPADGSLVSYIHPGVTRSVLILQPITETDAATLEALRSLPVLLTSYTFTQHVLSGEETWLRPQPRATVQLPRNDGVVPAVPAAEEDE